jgi:hypothetical protein
MAAGAPKGVPAAVPFLQEMTSLPILEPVPLESSSHA